VVHANAAFTRLTGVDSHEVNGRSISNLFSIPHPITVRASAHGGALQAAAAAGRARAQDEAVGMNVERLVAAKGFDDYHTIMVAAKPMEDGSDSVLCRMCVSPIIAKSMPTVDLAVVTDSNHEPHHHKRRKHHYHHEGHWKPAAESTMHRSPPQNVVTHHLIQLEKVSLEDSTRPDCAGRSDAADLLNKLEQAQQNVDREMMDADVEENLDEASQSSDPKEPVEAVG